jgi:type IV secretion system protein VirD4
MLKNNGYNVKVINLLEMDKSDCYNPFSYIREETDVVKLITNLISNTTPKGATPSDPFWEKAEGLFLQAIFYYVWLEEKPSRRNFETVLKLLGEAEVTEQGKPSRLDVRMKFLEENSPLGANHPAVKQYNKCMRGAGDTVRSIIISANSRLAFLENKQVLRLLSKDELNLADIGIGVNGDGETKTALFCVIPDSDKSYNFIIGMLYTQIFQELYYQADFNCGGRLPIHVTFMLDEFANVALPDDYCSLLSTMRSREISSIIIIQNFAQLKALFKDTWETIPGNCDTFIYLGGNEQSTHKYVSELLGKGTIDKKSSGETKGRQGSSSRNYDVLCREIFTPDEVR